MPRQENNLKCFPKRRHSTGYYASESEVVMVGVEEEQWAQPRGTPDTNIIDVTLDSESVSTTAGEEITLVDLEEINMESVGSDIQDVDSGDNMEFIAGNARRLIPLPPPPSEVAIRHSTANTQTTLICSVPRDTCPTQSGSHLSWNAQKSPAVAFLPMPLEPSYPQHPPHSSQPQASTGCGAVVHLQARDLNASMSSLPHHKHWIAPLRGVANTVIPLERQYFGRVEKRWLSGQEILIFECSVEGVGCAVW
ncbi:hypothetical protein C8R45DRAFT_942949 [Mycena sanguinolenta]|nr:hypothetical protein C8R45DRAFT_942949 [Mycena sanguinolenta]